MSITDKGTVKVRTVTYDWSVSCDLDIETKYSKNHFADIGKAFNVRNNRSIILNFDSPVDAVYAYNNIFASASDSGNDGYIDIEISVNDNTVTVTPKTEWEKGYNYIYIKDGMKDIYGNTLEKNYRYTIHVREG